MKNKLITSRDVDFAKWYTDIVKNANLASYSPTKGFIVYEPRSYALWENIQKEFDTKFKELGHTNVYLPMLIPESLLNKEKEHVEGFAPEVAWVTMGGSSKLDERLCIRPTSETLFSTHFSEIVSSYRNLPKLYNQWCSVLRWEKETRPFLRGREFLWQEGHTVHETSEEAEYETRKMLDVYQDVVENYLAIPALVGTKTEKEKFAGAEYTLTIEAMMYNGISLQSGTTHYFGQKFSIPFDIKFLNKENKYEYAYQTSWGISTRLLGAIIMVHGDDNGLIMPPKVAPEQVVIIPITSNEDVLNYSEELNNKLKENGIRSIIDKSEKSPGFKFAEHEMNGVPIRIEIGPKDLENNKLVLVRRDNYEKTDIDLNLNMIEVINEYLDKIHNSMFQKAKTRNESKTHTCTDLEEFKNIMENDPGFINAMWCGDPVCEEKIKEIRGTKSRCMPFNQEKVSDKCIYCGKEAKHLVVWGIQY